MKILKSKLKQIIKEEHINLLFEMSYWWRHAPGTLKAIFKWWERLVGLGKEFNAKDLRNIREILQQGEDPGELVLKAYKSQLQDEILRIETGGKGTISFEEV